MRLRIVTPLSVVVDEEIDSLRAEDASGSFGILPGHAPFLTVLTVSIVSWRQAERDSVCAVRGGALTVDDGSIIPTIRDSRMRHLGVAGADPPFW